jgi:sulfite reductase (NADPH) flavoprotein alpha-component
MTEQLRPAEIPLIPETAPFSPEQRAWLNGFFAGLLGAGGAPVPAAEVLPSADVLPQAPAEDFPWHDPALSLDERMQLAEGRAVARRLMAAMAQLDCGQCGYLCQTYAEALAAGSEASPSRCVPGGRDTARKLKALLAEAPAPAAAAKPPVPAAPKRVTVPARLLSRDVLNKPGSEKEVRHIALAFESGTLAYDVGDSLGVIAENCPDLVAAICGRLGGSGDAPVPCPDGVSRPLADALRAHLSLRERRL